MPIDIDSIVQEALESCAKERERKSKYRRKGHWIDEANGYIERRLQEDRDKILAPDDPVSASGDVCVDVGMDPRVSDALSSLFQPVRRDSLDIHVRTISDLMGLGLPLDSFIPAWLGNLSPGPNLVSILSGCMDRLQARIALRGWGVSLADAVYSPCISEARRSDYIGDVLRTRSRGDRKELVGSFIAGLRARGHDIRRPILHDSYLLIKPVSRIIDIIYPDCGQGIEVWASLYDLFSKDVRCKNEEYAGLMFAYPGERHHRVLSNLMTYSRVIDDFDSLFDAYDDQLADCEIGRVFGASIMSSRLPVDLKAMVASKVLSYGNDTVRNYAMKEFRKGGLPICDLAYQCFLQGVPPVDVLMPALRKGGFSMAEIEHMLASVHPLHADDLMFQYKSRARGSP